MSKIANPNDPLGMSVEGLEVLALALLMAVLSSSCTSGPPSGATSTVSLLSTTTIATMTTVAVSTTMEGPTTTGASTTTATPTTSTAEPATTVPTFDAATVISRLATDQPVVALTFDAGSDRGFAAEILDMLAAHGVEASFGMTGRWAESNPELLMRMAEEGHALINHTYDHPHMETLSTEGRLQQLARTEAIISGLTGVSTKPYFRPPYGAYNEQVLIDVASAEYRYSIMWTVDSLGWTGLSPGEVVARCRDGLQPGAILLMHVGSASTDYAALEDILSVIDQAGYRYATIQEMLS